MKVSINYRYIMSFAKDLSTMLYRMLIMWPSLIVGSLLFLFFVIGTLKGDVERIYLNVLSSQAQAYQAAPSGYMNVRDCVELPIELEGGYFGQCVNKSVALSEIAHRDLKNVNSFYCFLVLISMCIEGVYRFWLSHKMSKGVYGYGHGGAVSAKQRWDE
ncbi:hypothetical protein [Pectobacterium peruviense]|uniref:Uncharacterized protein n=1 Tax=Pectobacterium peruviense TaxID=2066479 RepID=A0ABX4S918_9GAMM|nr:hypothetical protein [Pectobacterium peruviense]KML70016.1 hypothetical protein G033_02800 [Pectobacterium peruviense]PKX82780.1 hypothetical protein A0G02_13690 [Pectobacterium peruviense]PKX87040.1 hypothetical protein A0G03_09065 [Pectobacterium peruviense]